MARVDNNNRLTPDAVQNYDLNPAASVVDKQSKYTPQLEEAAKLKQTAEGLSKLAKGISDIQPILARQAKENAIEAVANTEEKNQKDWAEVSRNIKGMAKFNPYNQEAYMNLRAKANMEQGVYELAKLEAEGADLEYDEFEARRQQILNQTVQNMNAEGLKAKHTAGYLTKLNDQSFKLKDSFVTKKAGQKYQILQNQMVSSASKDIATLTFDNPDGYLAGWNEAVTNLETMADSVGMDSTKKTELLYKTINQYLTDNVDDIDAEDFMIAVGQTTVNGQPLSDFDPNYATSMKQLLVKTKQAKYEVDSTDLKIEKLRLEKASLAAHAEIFQTLADPTKTLAEKKQKALEIIEANGMEAVGFDFLHKVANDEKTLLTLETTQTDPKVYEKLIQRYIAGELSQEEVLTASEAGQLGASDAYNLFKSLRTDDRRDCTTKLTYLNKRYLADNPDVDLGTNEYGQSNQEIIRKAVFEVTTNDKLSIAERNRRLEDIKRVAQHMEEQQELVHSADPMKLLTLQYMKTQKVESQSIADAQRSLAKMGMFQNQLGLNDTNIKVTSAMQKGREVTLSDGTKQTANHTGTDVATYNGRVVYAPRTGTVIASGYEKSMGNYILFKCADGGYVKLMHLQTADLPKAGTFRSKGTPIGRVGNTGNVTTKDTGVLHVECFNKRMKLVNPEEFLKGK